MRFVDHAVDWACVAGQAKADTEVMSLRSRREAVPPARVLALSLVERWEASSEIAPFVLVEEISKQSSRPGSNCVIGFS